MKVALYTEIDLTDTNLTEADVVKRAHTLGYEMMKFAGWSNSDCVNRKAEVKENGKILKEIGDTFDRNGNWPPSIFQVDRALANQKTCLEENEAQAVLAGLMQEGSDI